jgi:hypothetical protein
VIIRSVFADSNPSDDEETFTRERRGRGVRGPVGAGAYGPVVA